MFIVNDPLFMLLPMHSNSPFFGCCPVNVTQRNATVEWFAGGACTGSDPEIADFGRQLDFIVDQKVIRNIDKIIV